MPADKIARQIRIEGRVQGVGFRPFAFRLAGRQGVAGWVLNQGGVVELHVEGSPPELEAFVADLRNEKPPSARITQMEVIEADFIGYQGFTILESRDAGEKARVLPPDQAVCPDCLSEVRDPQNIRYRYAFAHCTQCGPRYTLTRGFPHDRAQTAMSAFPPCPRCLAEYEDPLNRRYHAQNICCPVCGPQLYFTTKGLASGVFGEPVSAALELIRRGGILAAKGMGGYHLICDARSTSSVRTLRERKHRPDRPFAVMIPFDALKNVPKPWGAKLQESSRPVVLVPKKLAPKVDKNVAPGLSELGLMLPDSPLHHLLAEEFQGPLIMTSANVSGQPMLTDEDEAEVALSRVADGFLHHDRPIDRPADDAVYRSIGGCFRPLRLGRGIAPKIQRLRHPVTGCFLAVGGDLKNTVALAHRERVVISPHLGDLVSARGLETFTQVVNELSELLDMAPDAVLCDAHPDYRSAQWAEGLGLPVIKIPHHHAHAAALYEEVAQTGSMLVFTFDGLGYGPDGSLWGGEALWGQPGAWQRVAGLRRIKLPGGDRASRSPWRMGVSVTFECGMPWRDAPEGAGGILQWLEKGVPLPETSSMGRLFDAAAALTGICSHQSYEGQAAMMLEAHSKGSANAVPLPLSSEAGILRWDWRPLIPLLLDSRRTAEERGSIFHASIAQAVVDLALRYRDHHACNAVGLTGGVFQNNLLTLEIQQRLLGSGVGVLIPERLPLNDAGLSFGQVVEAQSMQREKMAAE